MYLFCLFFVFYTTRTGASHWENDDMYGDFMMTGGYTTGISTETLALFHDMGWYTVDFSKAHPRYFRYKAGCDALKKKPSEAELLHQDNKFIERAENISKGVYTYVRRAFIPPGMMGDNHPSNQWDLRDTSWQKFGGSRSSICDEGGLSRGLVVVLISVPSVMVALAVIVFLWEKYIDTYGRCWCLVCERQVAPCLVNRICLCKSKRACCSKCLGRRCHCNMGHDSTKTKVAPKQQQKKRKGASSSKKMPASSSSLSSSSNGKKKKKQQNKKMNKNPIKNKLEMKNELAQIRNKYGAGSSEYMAAVNNYGK